MSETCATCRFWRRPPDVGSWGTCRRGPPVILDDSKPGLIRCAQPMTPEYDWCGEHRPSASPAERDAYTRAAVRYAEAAMRYAESDDMDSGPHHDEMVKADAAFLPLYREKHGG